MLPSLSGKEALMGEEPAGVRTMEEVMGTKPRLLRGERDCPTCQARGYVFTEKGLPWLCPKCNGERKMAVR